MLFPTIIARNLLHRPTRSLLTLLGISIGIAAVVALVGVATGFAQNWVKIHESRGTDVVVRKNTSKSPMPELFEESVRDELRRLPGVREASGVYIDMVSIGDRPNIFVFGLEPDSRQWAHLKIIKGRWPTNGEEHVVVLGTQAAETLEAKVGDKLPFDLREFTVCGIFESTAFIENGSAILTLPQIQYAMDTPGRIRFVDVKLRPGANEADVAEFRELIKKRLPGFGAFNAGESVQGNTGIQMAKAMSWATSAIAVVVGAVGVMNTMLMSVFERVREIGILLAVGWRRRRVMTMIVGESLTLCLFGGVLGFGLGVGMARLLDYIPRLHGKIVPMVDLSIFGLAMAVALVVGLLGGLYPAWRASRLQPAEAMRRE